MYNQDLYLKFYFDASASESAIEKREIPGNIKGYVFKEEKLYNVEITVNT